MSGEMSRTRGVSGGPGAVLVVDEFEEEQVEDGDKEANRGPEQHRQAAEVMAMLVKDHDVVLMGWRCNQHVTLTYTEHYIDSTSQTSTVCENEMSGRGACEGP